MSHRQHRQHRAQSIASATSTAPTTSSSLSRPPPALRGPASRLTPRASHPHVSLVFARGDAAVPAGPPSLRRIANGASPSEEALSRQLDRDGAGERLGLRSRRSSTATLASVRTEYNVSVVALGVTSPAVLEEEEPVAGPSRLDASSTIPSRSASPAPSLPGLPIDQFHSLLPRPPLGSASGTSTPQRRLNPKSSSTWRRWNPPTPSFPKSKSRDTSRDRRGSVASQQQADNTVVAPLPPPAPLPDSTPVVAPNADQPETAPASAVQDLASVPIDQPATIPPAATASVKPEDIPPPASMDEAEPKVQVDPVVDTSTLETTPPPPAPAPEAPAARRGWMSSWWGSSEPVPVPPPAPKVLEAAPLTAEPEAVAVEEVAAPAPRPLASSPPSLNGSAHAPLTKVKTNASEDTNGSGKRRKLSSNVVQEPARPPSVAAVADVRPEPSAAAAPAAPSEASHGSHPSNDGVLVTRDEPAVPTVETTVNAVAAAQSAQTGWGSYLVSFVYSGSSQPAQTTDKAPSIKAPSTREPSTTSTHHIVEPTDPVTDQKPVHSVELAQPVPSVEKTQPTQPPAQLIEPPTPRPTPQPTALSDADTAEASATATTTTSPQQQPKLATSSSSTGWLQYLAFRASQKKITGSTVGSERDGRRSGETVREEVMDLDGDPDFPPAEAAAPATVPPATTQPTPALLPPAPITTVKDLKVDTTKSANGSAAVKSSNSTQRLTHKRSQNLAPQTQARRQSNASSSASIPPMPPSPRTTASGTAAPAPVKTSTSLPPPPKPPSRQPSLVIPSFASTFDRPPRSFLPRQRNTGAGVAASTWRAFGAVSSYVVGDKTESPEETRGKKEGRDVGSDLPRRIGLLGTGSPDDGWKNVKRIAVIGVHGWFPARMLNT